ncbi:MAG: hypothetical protein ACFHU9_02480 [Fluviicola sp.]
MKTFTLLTLLLLSFGSLAQKGKVQFTSEFKNITQGYDHTCKEKIFINGELIFTSKEHPESEILKAKVKLPRGTHNVRIENWTRYKGNWELTAIDDDYSIDGFYEDELTIGKKNELHIVYDLDDQSSPHVTCNKIK